MRRLFPSLLIALLLHLLATPGVAQSPARQQAQAIVSQMTAEEKLQLVHGASGAYVGNVPGIARLGVPDLNLEDGPQGVSDGTLGVTCWPSALTVVASWNTALMGQFAAAMALEERQKGTNIHLAPMVNIGRVPVGGRNFESFGEDPCLAAAMTKASITGIQSQGIMATVKHFVDNNQEQDRRLVSADVPQRAQWEIYYPAFAAAVEAGVAAVMCSYNRINSTYACQNAQTLSDLKNRMGFEGFVMSDWGATHSTVEAANAGLDMEMPGDLYFGDLLEIAIAIGKVPQARLDDMATRIVTALIMVGLLNQTSPTGNLSVPVNSTAHAQLAQQLAEAGTVLVKNEASLLPLSLKSIKSIAILGDDGNDVLTVTGNGSGHVIPPFIISPLAAIQKLVPSDVRVTYAPTANASLAAQLAAEADVAIVFVATTSSEGSDRPSLSLGDAQDALVSAVSAVQNRTVVVVHTPGAVLMPWLDSVASVFVAFLPGQADGAAIANTVFGAANPSGRLPLTFPAAWPFADPIWPTRSEYPGELYQTQYAEGLLVGYRWHDAYNDTPLFPFGHGLSYTTFAYSGLAIAAPAANGSVAVSFTLANTGALAGAEVWQLYVGFPPSAGEPPRVLRAFSSVMLSPNAAVPIGVQLAASDLSIWDVTASDWAVVHGEFGVYVGASSRDIRLQGSFAY